MGLGDTPNPTKNGPLWGLVTPLRIYNQAASTTGILNRNIKFTIIMGSTIQCCTLILIPGAQNEEFKLSQV